MSAIFFVKRWFPSSSCLVTVIHKIYFLFILVSAGSGRKISANIELGISELV